MKCPTADRQGGPAGTGDKSTEPQSGVQTALPYNPSMCAARKTVWSL